MKKIAFTSVLLALACSSVIAQTVRIDQPTKRALSNALEEIRTGNRILENKCLPIYSGHRVKAINFGKESHLQIRVGILEQKLDKMSAQNKTYDQENRSKYSAEQIQKSNFNMVRGGEHYQRAIVILQNVNWNYNNRKTLAIKALNSALNEITLGLQPFGGVNANRPPKNYLP
jgi:hypothetical protein